MAGSEKPEEAPIQSREDLFREVFDKNPGLVALSDPDTGRHVDVNATWLSVLGYDRADIIGRTTSEFGLWKRAAQRDEMVALLKQDGEIRNFEADFLKKDRSDCAVLVSGSLITFQGELCLFLIGQDVTREKNGVRRAADRVRQPGSTNCRTYPAAE